MHSLKNQCCYDVTRLPSEMETGCRQLLHKLKSCKETEIKGSGEEMERVRCWLYKDPVWLFLEVNTDKETTSIVPL